MFIYKILTAFWYNEYTYLHVVRRYINIFTIYLDKIWCITFKIFTFFFCKITSINNKSAVYSIRMITFFNNKSIRRKTLCF